jgi:predicted ferric reductase
VDSADHTFWYLTRASGVVSYLALFISVTLGLSMTTSLGSGRLQRFKVYDFHRFLSLVTIGLTMFHIFIVLPDGYIGFSIGELLIPFTSPYRPAFMALGIFSFYLTSIIILSFYALPRLPYATWRLIHYATLLAFAMALAHGIGAGTDTGSVWAIALYASTAWLVMALGLYRILRGSARGIRPHLEVSPVSSAASKAVLGGN